MLCQLDRFRLGSDARGRQNPIGEATGGGANPIVLVQREDDAAGMSKRRDSALRAWIFKAAGSFNPIAVAGSIRGRARFSENYGIGNAGPHR